MCNVKILTRKSWMEPFHSYLSLLFYHQDMVVKLPQGAELISTSNYCKVQNNMKNEFHHALESLRIRDNSLIISQLDG